MPASGHFVLQTRMRSLSGSNGDSGMMVAAYLLNL